MSAESPQAPSKSPTSGTRIHALVFDDPRETLEAVKTLRARDVAVRDVFSPFPVHGLSEALGLKPTRLPYATLVGGICGAAIALSFQIWTHTVSWPLNIGGKTDLALPALIPVAFELTVLLAAFGTLFALLFSNRLRPTWSGARREEQPLPGVTDDKFVVLIEDNDPPESNRLRALWSALEPSEVIESWRTE